VANAVSDPKEGRDRHTAGSRTGILPNRQLPALAKLLRHRLAATGRCNHAVRAVIVLLFLGTLMLAPVGRGASRSAYAADPPSDEVSIQGASATGGPVGLRAAGTVGGICSDEWAAHVAAATTEWDVAATDLGPGCVASVAAFQAGSGAYIAEHDWSQGAPENVVVELGRAPLDIPVRVWFAGVDVAQSQYFESDFAVTALATNAAYDSSRLGIRFKFDTAVVKDDWERARIADAALEFSTSGDCQVLREVCAYSAHRQGVINVYYVPELSLVRGRACASAGLIAVDGLAVSGLDATLMHELGHLLALDHVSATPPWPGDHYPVTIGSPEEVSGNVMCVMDPECYPRTGFTLGQAFRANSDERSVVKRFHPGADLTVDCSGSGIGCPGPLDPAPEAGN